MECFRMRIAPKKVILIATFCCHLSACSMTGGLLPANDLDSDRCQDDAISKIVNGRLVTLDEPLAKEAVLLVISKKNFEKAICTAMPISSRILLTAAHCVSGVDPRNIQAIFNISLKCEEGFSREKMISSESYKIHPDYDQTPQSKADLALIRLQQSIPGDYPIAILYDGKSPLSNSEVHLLGFGITKETDKDSMRLRMTKKNFEKDIYIKSQLLMINQSNETGGFCRGDSGAPVYVHVGQRKKLIGVNSFTIGREENRECHTASAAMYIPFFTSWILRSSLEM